MREGVSKEGIALRYQKELTQKQEISWKSSNTTSNDIEKWYNEECIPHAPLNVNRIFLRYMTEFRADKEAQLYLSRDEQVPLVSDGAGLAFDRQVYRDQEYYWQEQS